MSTWKEGLQKRLAVVCLPTRALVAVVALIATLTALIPCEGVQAVESGQVASFQADAPEPLTDNESTPSCPDGCACLCAGSFCGAVDLSTAQLAFHEVANQITPFHPPSLSRLLSERFFRPPRHTSVT